MTHFWVFLLMSWQLVKMLRLTFLSNDIIILPRLPKRCAVFNTTSYGLDTNNVSWVTDGIEQQCCPPSEELTWRCPFPMAFS